MNLIISSLCSGKSVTKTRRVLDSYGIHVGNKHWNVSLTDEGLQHLIKELSACATKSTSVAIFRSHPDHQPELIKIIGNKRPFTQDNACIVKIKAMERKAEIPFEMQPLIEAILSLSAISHDLGKNTNMFGGMLHSGEGKNFKSDGLRHEITSTHLMDSIIGEGLEISQAYKSLHLRADIIGGAAPKVNLGTPYEIAKSIAATHHRLLDGRIEGNDVVFTLKNHKKYDINANDLMPINADALRFDSKFAQRIISKIGSNLANDASPKALSDLKACADPLLCTKPDNFDKAAPAIYVHARAAFLMGDHFYSSLNAEGYGFKERKFLIRHNKDAQNIKPNGVYANTINTPTGRDPNQGLEDHILGVASSVSPALASLEYLRSRMPGMDAKPMLKIQPVAPRFEWQNKAVRTVQKAKEDNPNAHFFGILNAATGSGKTGTVIRVASAASPDPDVRLTMTSPLRVVSRQTRDELADRFCIDSSNLGLAAGGIKQPKDVRPNKAEDAQSNSTHGVIESKVQGSDLDDDSDLEVYIENETMLPNLVTRYLNGSEFSKSFLSVPLLCCTIDFINKAFEPERGNHLLAYQRLISSDIIIDEADDYKHAALLRIAYMVGLAGRNLFLISATLHSDAVANLYKAYVEGLSSFYAMRGVEHKVTALLLSEGIQEAIHNADDITDAVARIWHERAKIATDAPAYRMGCIIDMPPMTQGDQYFEAVLKASLKMHKTHAVKNGNKTLSAGCIRLDLIKDLAAFARFLARVPKKKGWPHIKVILNHGQFTAGERSYKNFQLARLLSHRAGSIDGIWADPDIIKMTEEHNNAMLLVLTTSTGERGTNWDFDWLVAEPSSIESLIQMSGRVNRHRLKIVSKPNVGIMRYPTNRGQGKMSKDIHKVGHDLKSAIGPLILKKIDARALLGDKRMAKYPLVKRGIERLANKGGFFNDLETSKKTDHKVLIANDFYIRNRLRDHTSQYVVEITADGRIVDPQTGLINVNPSAPVFTPEIDIEMSGIMFGLWRREDVYSFVCKEAELTHYQERLSRQLSIPIYSDNQKPRMVCDALGAYTD